MVELSKQQIIQVLSLLLINACANQLPPGGGEVDKIPPEVVEVYPPNGTTNYDDNYFEMEFLEYVDKRSFKDALFISPFIEGRLEHSWTGTSVTVEFIEGLKEDVTYTISVGTDVVDINNHNRMSNAYTFSFSTGNVIDRRTISGKVYSEEPEGVLIFAYKLKNDSDSLLKRKPDYVSQTGSDGNFHLKGLGESDYRIFAVKDEFRDLIYDLDQDLIGVPYQDISLVGPDTSFVDMKFKLFKADTTAPRLLKGIMTDEKHILVSLTEELDKELLLSGNFYLVDSTSNHTSALTYIFKKYGKNDELVFVPAENFVMENSIYLFAKVLRDTVHNEYVNDFIHLTLSDKPDTTAINLIATEPPNNNAVIDFINPKLKFYFDDGLEKKDLQRSISFTDTLGKGVPFKFELEDDASLIVTPLKNLKPEKDYIIKLDLNAFVDAAGNKRDSMYEFNFRTISGLDFTGVTGKIINVDFNLNPVLVLESAEKNKLKYQKSVLEENFNFERVVAGKYTLWCYFDVDTNYLFNYGWPQPIQNSERFSVYSDTLKLKPRWVITDVLFNFK